MEPGPNRTGRAPCVDQEFGDAGIQDHGGVAILHQLVRIVSPVLQIMLIEPAALSGSLANQQPMMKSHGGCTMPTAAFDREASQAVCRWGVRERAALGLCLENVPPPFQTRYLVPVSLRTGKLVEFARISHLPNNYANDPRSPLGKVRLDELFVGVHDLSR
jgi:hypothetical protein